MTAPAGVQLALLPSLAVALASPLVATNKR